MARLFAGLKFRLLRNALRASGRAKASFIVSTSFAALFAVGIFALLATLRGGSAAVDLTTVIFTLFAFGWLIVPVMAFGADNTLDPAALALFPLRTGPLAAGLLAASATGAWPLANVVGLLGVTVGLARGGLGLLIAVIAVVLQVLFCITLARLVTTGMAGLLRSRRGKDLAAFLFIPIFAAYEIFAQIIPKAAAQGSLTAASFTGIDTWMRWLPPGLAAHAIQDASDGRAGVAVVRLALLAAVTALLGLLWVRVLGHSLVTADTSTQSSRVRGGTLPLGRYGIGGAVAARYWIYQRREPASLIYWGITAVIMVAVSIRAAVAPGGSTGILLVSAIFGAAFVGVFHANAVGATGPPFILEALALTGRRPLRGYLAGLDVALAAIAVPLLAAVTFGLAALAKHPGYGFAAFAVDLAGLGAALGIGNVLTATLAYPMEKRVGSPMRTAAAGSAGYGLAGTFGTLAGVAVLTSPVIAAAVLTGGSASAAVRVPVLLAGSAGYGFALALAGVWAGAAAADARLPELCQVASRSTV